VGRAKDACGGATSSGVRPRHRTDGPGRSRAGPIGDPRFLHRRSQRHRAPSRLRRPGRRPRGKGRASWAIPPAGRVHTQKRRQTPSEICAVVRGKLWRLFGPRASGGGGARRALQRLPSIHHARSEPRAGPGPPISHTGKRGTHGKDLSGARAARPAGGRAGHAHRRHRGPMGLALGILLVWSPVLYPRLTAPLRTYTSVHRREKNSMRSGKLK
jgi:hypothetical protein